MSAEPPGPGLRHQAARGVAWSAVDAVGSRLISAVVFIALARILPPTAFGLVALSLTFIAFTRLLVDQGLGQAIVQRKDLSKSHLDTAFWTTLVAGVLMAGVLYLAAGLAADLLDIPRLEPVLQALSLVVAIGAPSSTAAAVLRRHLNFRGLAQRRLTAAVAGGVAGVAAALLGFGVWALVAQALTQTVVSTVTLWLVTPYRPGLALSWTQFKELFGFSTRVIGISFVSFVSKHSDDLLIGGVLGPAALGLYSVAYRLLTIMTEVLSTTIDKVGFSTFSKVQDDLPRLRRGYAVALRSSIAVAAPAYLVVAVLSRDVILTFFGERWVASIPVMQALAAAGVAHAIYASSNTLLLSVGRAQTALRLTTVNAVVGVAAFAVAVPFGIQAVALAFTLRAYLLAPFSVHEAKRSLGLTWRGWLAMVAPPVLTAAVVAAAVLGVGLLLPETMLAPVRLLIGLLVGVTLYLVLFGLLFRSRLVEVLTMAGQAFPPLARLTQSGRATRRTGEPVAAGRGER